MSVWFANNLIQTQWQLRATTFILCAGYPVGGARQLAFPKCPKYWTFWWRPFAHIFYTDIDHMYRNKMVDYWDQTIWNYLQSFIWTILFVRWGLTSLLNIWGHIATVPTCSSDTFKQCAAIQECHAADRGHDTPSRHIQTQGQPVVVLSIKVERYTGMHNYPF